MSEPSNPLTDLQAKLRGDQDRRDELAIEARALTVRFGLLRDELRQLDAVIAATRGLLALADRAINTKTDDAKPAAKRPTTTTRKGTSQ